MLITAAELLRGWAGRYFLSKASTDALDEKCRGFKIKV